MKAYTNLEQSKKLLAIGIPAESADMCYLPTHVEKEHHYIATLSSYSECTKMQEISIDYCIPCWSLSALLELMPKCILIHGDSAYLNISLFGGFFSYDMGLAIEKATNNYDNLIDAALELLEWLKEQKYI